MPYFFAAAFQADVAQTMGIPTKALHYFSIWMLSHTVVASLQTVGVILVVSMLIIPASTALIISNKLRNVLRWSMFLGAFTAAVGMMASVYWDTAPGPAITLSATALYVLVLLGHPLRGIWPRLLRRYLRLVRHWAEDLVKLLFRKPEISKDQVLESLRWSGFTYSAAVLCCRLLGWVQKLPKNQGFYALTAKGHTKAMKLVRAHRLWESYLAQKQGFEPHQLHWLAEKDEHYLPQAFLDQIDQRLGFPDMDPHGSPIPRGTATKAKGSSS